MVREDTVEIRVKAGCGTVTYCTGHNYDIQLGEGTTASTWGNGSPIFRREFESLLEPTGLFELVKSEEGGK